MICLTRIICAAHLCFRIPLACWLHRAAFLHSKQCLCDIALIRFVSTLRGVFEDGVRASVGAALLVVGSLCIAMSIAVRQPCTDRCYFFSNGLCPFVITNWSGPPAGGTIAGDNDGRCSV